MNLQELENERFAIASFVFGKFSAWAKDKDINEQECLIAIAATCTALLTLSAKLVKEKNKEFIDEISNTAKIAYDFSNQPQEVMSKQLEELHARRDEINS